jgi:hypothetical protein
MFISSITCHTAFHFFLHVLLFTSIAISKHYYEVLVRKGQLIYGRVEDAYSCSYVCMSNKWMRVLLALVLLMCMFERS